MTSQTCDWKATIDSGTVVLFVIDQEYLDDPEIDMQAAYAAATKKPVRALIEAGHDAPKCMLELPDFMYENFDPNSKRSFELAMQRLVKKHYQKANPGCPTPPIEIDLGYVEMKWAELHGKKGRVAH